MASSAVNEMFCSTSVILSYESDAQTALKGWDSALPYRGCILLPKPIRSN